MYELLTVTQCTKVSVSSEREMVLSDIN